MNQILYDIIIVGAGPAGMTAGVYGARAGLKVLMLDKGAPGGQMVNTYEIENYTGFDAIQGPDLALKMFDHTQKLGVEYAYGDVQTILQNGALHQVQTDNGIYDAKTVIIATGTKTRRLDVPGEDQLAGRGVSWCAICDGALYKNKEVAVIGGGNSALQEALYLAGITDHVTIIHRRQEFRADKLLQERCMSHPNIQFELDTIVESFNEDKGRLGSITLRNTKTQVKKEIPMEGAFLYVGLVPVTSMLQGVVTLDEQGYVITNDKMETNITGIYAAGDVRQKELRQIVTATSDGAVATQMALQYIKSKDW